MNLRIPKQKSTDSNRVMSLRQGGSTRYFNIFLFLLLLQLYFWGSNVSSNDVITSDSYLMPNDDAGAKTIIDNNNNNNNLATIDNIIHGVTFQDLIALTKGDKNFVETYEMMRTEQLCGQRDKYFIKTSYNARLDNLHYVDIKNKDEYQKEVYLMALLIMRKLVPTSPPTPSIRINNINFSNDDEKRGLVADIGAGSGYKLATYLAPEFHTIGFETEPAITYLRKTYPNLDWIDSGKPEESLPTSSSWLPSPSSSGRKGGMTKKKNGNGFDVCICSDVIEHIRDPDELLKFLVSLQCKVYVLSTPNASKITMPNGPPKNKHHVREWTMREFLAYLTSSGFRVVRAIEGIQHESTQVVIAVLD